jgi:hypothetical protein
MTEPIPAVSPEDAAAAGFATKVRWLMAISGVTTLVAIAAVLGVIGYRVFKTDIGATPAEVTALLPKGARVIAIAPAADRIVVTIELAGALEARTFDLKTLKPTGRLRFATEP